MSYLRALAHWPFALLWSGQTLSRLGDFIFQIALAWWVLQKTGSAIAMGAVMVFSILPMVVFLLAGGIAVDRFPRVQLLLFSDLGRGAVMALLTGLVLIDRLEIWMVYLAILAFSFADAFSQPAYTALVPQITPPADWTSANSLSSLSFQLSRVMGPAAGGLIMAWAGPGVAFGLNALSFFVSGLLLIPLMWTSGGAAVLADAPASGGGPAQVLEDLREGWRIIFSVPVLWITIAVASIDNILMSGPFSVAMPFLVKDFLGGDEKMLGFLLAIFPIGYILSGFFLGSRERIRWRGLIVFIGMVVAGAGLAVFGIRVPFLLLIAAAIVNGAALEATSLTWTNLLQEIVPADKLGRVSSIDLLGSFALLPLGYALTGWAVDAIGPATVFVLCGGLAALLSSFVLLYPRIHNFD